MAWTFTEVNDKGIEHTFTVTSNNGALSCDCPGFGSKKTVDGQKSCRHIRQVQMSGEAPQQSSGNTYSVSLSSGKVSIAETPSTAGLIHDIKPQLLQPIEEADVEKYLNDTNFGAQEKMDGKRILLDCRENTPIAFNKKGEPCIIPDDILLLARSRLHGCVVDGELINGKLYLFDMLWNSGLNIQNKPYGDRYFTLRTKNLPDPGQETDGDLIAVCPLAIGSVQKHDLYNKLKDREGIVFKRLSAHYKAARNFDQLKFKFVASVSCYVLQHNNPKSSVRIGLLNPSIGDYTCVGNCTIPQSVEIPAVNSIIEVRYLYANKGGSLFQPVFKEVRDDTDVDTMDQLKYKHQFHGPVQIEQTSVVKETPKPSAGIIIRKVQWQ